MQIGKLDIGIWHYPNGNPFKWYQRWFEVSHLKAHCGCHIVTLGLVCITWLSNECIEADS